MKKIIKVKSWYYWRGFRRGEWVVEGWEGARAVIGKLRKDALGMDELRDRIRDEKDVGTIGKWKEIRAELEYVELEFASVKRKTKTAKWIEMPAWDKKGNYVG